MIVISNALYLQPPVDELPNSPLIFWHNVVTPENLTADTEDGDYPAINLANPNTALHWVADDTTDQYLTVVTGYEGVLDYIAVAKHNFGSAGVIVSVEGKANSGASWVEIVEETTLTDDKPLIMRFREQVLSHVRLKLQPGGTEPSASVLYIGKSLVMPTGIPVGFTPVTYGRKTEVLNGRSEKGNFLGKIITGRWLESEVGFQYLDGDWYRANFDPFVAAAEEAPFFFAWAPEAYPGEVGFCWLTDDPRPSIDHTGGEMNVSLQYAALAL